MTLFFEIFNIFTNNIISVEAAKVLTIRCDSFVNEVLSSYQRNSIGKTTNLTIFVFVKGVHVNLGLSKLVFTVVSNITQFWTKVIA